ncbi:hypothetical protein [Embleya sp. AB8]|uniref:hypothetical protein n=1 Tax=Embleya sp. AB8 TaxID=3156304 RepID=UPI003C731FE4
MAGEEMSYSPVGLPLHFDFIFRPWHYSVSMRRLILRGQADGDPGAVVDVMFLDVAGMKVRREYAALTITEAGEVAEIENFVDISDRNARRFMRLLVSDGTHEGFVVCGAIRMRAGKA